MARRRLKQQLPRPVAATMAAIAGTSEVASTNRLHQAMVEKARLLIDNPDVIGFGFGTKTVRGEPSGEKAIIFYVRRKLSLGDIDPNQLLPELLVDPKGRAIATDIIEVGDVHAHTNAADEPVRGGFSISHARGAPGTLSAIVGKGRERFLLSAQHVLTNFDQGAAGDAIYFPGRSDGGDANDRVATLSPFTPLQAGPNYPNLVDAALAQLQSILTKSLDLGALGARTPIDIADAQDGQQVALIGRTSSTTRRARIKSVNVYADLYYPDLGYIGFQRQIGCEPLGQGGDSGALVVAADSGSVIGLQIGGSDEFSYVTPIRAVLKALGARFLTAS